MAADAVRETGPAELVTQDPVGVATVIAHEDRDVPRVAVRDGDREARSARGATVIVIRTPQGAPVPALALRAELRGR